MRDVLFSTVATLIIMPTLIVGVHVVGAEAMQSTNYRIQSDSINFGGGLSTSTNYSLESTAGEVATGESGSPSYNLFAGYQQMQEVFISLSAVGPVTLSPSIPGISGGEANGSTTVTVVTDSAAGYQLLISAEGSPAMQKGAFSIADYVPVGVPDFDFALGASDAHFGYSPEGVNVAQRFLDDGADCGVGSGNVLLKCWDGLSTTDVVIAQSSGANQPNGATTTINFRVGIGGSVIQSPGIYTATTTLTALPL